MRGRQFYNKVTNSSFDIIAEFLKLLKRERIDYCVIGGVGINAYCEPVVTLDFDCVITIDKMPGLRDKLKSKGFKVKAHLRTFEITHSGSDIRIQVQRDERYQEFIERAELCKVLGYKMRVAKKEDLVLGKLWAYKDEERDELKREKDLLDIRRMIDKYPELREVVNRERVKINRKKS